MKLPEGYLLTFLFPNGETVSLRLYKVRSTKAKFVIVGGDNTPLTLWVWDWGKDDWAPGSRYLWLYPQDIMALESGGCYAQITLTCLLSSAVTVQLDLTPGIDTLEPHK